MRQQNRVRSFKNNLEEKQQGKIYSQIRFVICFRGFVRTGQSKLSSMIKNRAQSFRVIGHSIEEIYMMVGGTAYVSFQPKVLIPNFLTHSANRSFHGRDAYDRETVYNCT
jgi:hypothetical protein